MNLFSDWLSLKDAPPPTSAVEIAEHQVSAASIDIRGGRPVIAAHAAEPLPEGALAPALASPNVHDRQAVAGAVARVLEAIGRPRRVGLIVPDPVAKVSLVRFEHLPPRQQDLDQLIRWQVRKAAPFPSDEAQVSYVAGRRTSDGSEFVVALAKRGIIQEYEALVAACGAHAGIVDVSTFNVINAALATAAAPPVADWLVVNVASDYASIAILRGADLMFFRSRAFGSEGTLADFVHQTAMYYEDRLQGSGFERVMLSGASVYSAADVDRLHRGLHERLGRAVEAVDLTAAAAFTDRISATPAFLDTVTPLVGLLVRGREAAA